MCGIFGYAGPKPAAKKIITGLKRLEYRGYDSWGVAVTSRGIIKTKKRVGEIGKTQSIPRLTGKIGIGHTRWATHGGVTVANAHPHLATDGSFALAHNGVVENFSQLKSQLQEQGYIFHSQTDTEVIVRLIEEKRTTHPNIKEAIIAAFNELAGRNTIIVLDNKQHLLAVRNGSPLVVGVGQSEVYISSDSLSFAEETNKVVFVDDGQMVEVQQGKISITDVKTNLPVKFDIHELKQQQQKISHNGYDHFMLKEIIEQPHSIRRVVDYSRMELASLIKVIHSAHRVYTLGAGTASFAAGQIAYYLRSLAGVQATELLAYEISSYRQNFTDQDVMIVVSQSGETADTLEAIQAAQSKEVKIASIVNTPGSTISRLSDFPFFCNCGPEVCVASTKSFTTQVVWGWFLAMAVTDRHRLAKMKIQALSLSLKQFLVSNTLKQYQQLADKLKSHSHFFVLGRGQNRYISLEGALKLKEISYKHFEGFAAGELKHGVIALIEKGTPVILIVSEDEEYDNLITAAAEVKARGAWTIGIASHNHQYFDDFLPVPRVSALSAIVNVIPFQLLAYYLGIKLGHNPDKPRNLAKSVTVK